MERTRLYLNTWRAYNEGSIGYGWMSAEEAENFIKENPERDGGEWFIADIDNYTGVKFSSLDYCNVMEVIQSIKILEDSEESERNEVVALMEYLNTDSAEKAIDEMDNYTFYTDIDSFHDCMDELIDEELASVPDSIARYFDYEEYHRECDFDVTEMSNGVVIAA